MKNILTIVTTTLLLLFLNGCTAKEIKKGACVTGVTTLQVTGLILSGGHANVSANDKNVCEDSTKEEK